MSVRNHCNREVVTVERDAPIRDAVNLMRSDHVGDVVVVEKSDGGHAPVGILTDRDIVVQILAEDVDIDAVNVTDVMSYELVTLPEATTLVDAIWILRENGVRRAPVVDDNGLLTGIITVDDILAVIAEQLTDLVQVIAIEQAREGRERR